MQAMKCGALIFIHSNGGKSNQLLIKSMHAGVMLPTMMKFCKPFIYSEDVEAMDFIMIYGSSLLSNELGG